MQSTWIAQEYMKLSSVIDWLKSYGLQHNFRNNVTIVNILGKLFNAGP